MDSVITIPYSEAQRMEMRSLVNIAGEVIAHYWPMRTFIYRNVLHGLEYLDFESAVKQGQRFLGGHPYLSNDRFREYFKAGRIRVEDVDTVLKPLAQDKSVPVGNTRITHLEVLRAHLLQGGTTPGHGKDAGAGGSQPKYAALRALTDRLRTILPQPHYDERLKARVQTDTQVLARDVTLSVWCDRVLGTRIVEQINEELIKWCGAFVDEGHAAWTMPHRDSSFYNAWKFLAQHDFSGTFLGIQDWKHKILSLPERPEDAILLSLETLGIPKALWEDYLSLQLGALPGWTGFIKWRAEETGYEWQAAFPASLVKYLAIRLFYERELVSMVCRRELDITGDYTALLAFMQDQPHVYDLRKARMAGMLNTRYAYKVDRLRYGSPRGAHEVWNTLADHYRADILNDEEENNKECQTQARRLLSLASSLQIEHDSLTHAASGDLQVLLNWLDDFPETHHGPYWLQAFEAGYRTALLETLRPNVIKHLGVRDSDHEQTGAVRPLTQAVLCIDVRSEGFRRHLEEIGGYETLGFAGFFAVPFRFQAFGSHRETDQCPVLLTPKHVVREVPRAYQSLEAEKHLAGIRLFQTGDQLLHELKENVITPYVMVEAMGWFYAIPFILKTTMATWYRECSSWLRRMFTPTFGTTLTVNKITEEEALSMLAAEQRPTIRLALREQLGLSGSHVSQELIETLRQYALEEKEGPLPDTYRRVLGLSFEQETAFIDTLRRRYHIDSRGASARLHRITQTGFTLNEQASFVETNLHLMGLTKHFARFVFLCSHGSTSENNPFESGLDCGACGGNDGMPNVRTFAAMANKPEIRALLRERGMTIPQDTYFLAGQIDTTTDAVQLFDLEDVPSTHRHHLSQLIRDLEEASRQNSLERCARFPDIHAPLSAEEASREVKNRSLDWSQVRPEWGLSRNAAFIVGHRNLTRNLNLEGRTFLHSYDWQGDPTGKYLQVILTAPGVVIQWISMEHYFSTVAPTIYGSGSKMYHNITGRIGVMFGTQSDLRVGLPWQTVMNGEDPNHEAMRPLYLVESPRDRLTMLIEKNEILKRFFDGRWVHLVALEPEEGTFYHYVPRQGWQAVP